MADGLIPVVLGGSASSSNRIDFSAVMGLPVGMGTLVASLCAVVPVASASLVVLVSGVGESVPVSPLPWSKFALCSNRWIRLGSNCARSSCFSSLISSSVIEASFILFSSSICCLSFDSKLDPCVLTGWDEAGLDGAAGAFWEVVVTSLTEGPLCCLNADILMRFLCSGKPVVEGRSFGEVGGFTGRSVMSCTKSSGDAVG